MQYNTLSVLFAVTCLAAASNGASIDPALEYDEAFASSVLVAENAGTMPAWYSNLPESVQEFESTKLEAIRSYGSTATQDWPTFTDSSTTATAVATSTSSSSSSDENASSASTGGAPAVTGDFFLGIAGAAGILGLAIAL
ncbi:unnamed protein product [Penicillium bialowiezense]